VGLLAVTVLLVALMVPLAVGREEAFDTVLYATLPLVLGVVGTLIASRQPGNPIGWLFCGWRRGARWRSSVRPTAMSRASAGFPAVSPASG
jgi:hypothetical protein